MLTIFSQRFIFYVLSLTHLSLTSVYKLPQIRCVYNTKSVIGISLSSCIIDVLSQTIYCLYNFKMNYAILTYLDYVVTDTTVIIFLIQVLYYKNILFDKSIILSSILILLLLQFSYNSYYIINNIIILSTLCSLAGKLLQIVEINAIIKQKQFHKLKNLSIPSWLILILTSSIKLFLYLFISLEPLDYKLLLHCVQGLFLNIYIVGLLHYYSKTDTKSIKNKSK